MKFDVLNRYTGAVQFTAEIDCAGNTPHARKLGFAVQLALNNGANMSGADLSGADLGEANMSGAYLGEANMSGAYLRGADLSGADLRGADLSGANMSGADLGEAYLSEANMSGAYLSGANMSGAYLSGANMSGAYLSGANMSGANMSGAYLSGADLDEANMSGADLSGADLGGANLSGAEGIPKLYAAQTLITPDGQIIGWKKCRGGTIVKLSIPAEARRSNATGRKCRASFADVLEVFGAEVGISSHDGKTEYRPGQRIACDKWCDDRWHECAGGIHFFLTREEAEAY